MIDKLSKEWSEKAGLMRFPEVHPCVGGRQSRGGGRARHIARSPSVVVEKRSAFSSTDLTIFLLADLIPALLGDVTIFLPRGTSIRFGVSGPFTTYRLTQAAVARRARLLWQRTK